MCTGQARERCNGVLTSLMRLMAGEKQQKSNKALQIPFLHQAIPSAPKQPMIGMKLRPGVPLPTWICDTVSVRPHADSWVA